MEMKKYMRRKMKSFELVHERKMLFFPSLQSQ